MLSPVVWQINESQENLKVFTIPSEHSVLKILKNVCDF